MKHTLFPKLIVQSRNCMESRDRCAAFTHTQICVCERLSKIKIKKYKRITERERERFTSLVFGTLSGESYSCMPTIGGHCRSEARPLLCFWTNQPFFFPFISCLSCDPCLGLLFTIVLSILFQNLVAFTWASCRWFSSDQYESPCQLAKWQSVPLNYLFAFHMTFICIGCKVNKVIPFHRTSNVTTNTCKIVDNL